MPYQSVWIDPEVALDYKGIKVYFAYRDDDYDQGESHYCFLTDPLGSVEEAFDVRELATWKEPPHPPYISGVETPELHEAWEKYHEDRVEEKAMEAALRDAIDQGLIKNRSEPAESG